MAIRFERDGAVGSIVPIHLLTVSICVLRRLCGSQCIRPVKATYVCWSFARRGHISASAVKCANGRERTSTGSGRSLQR